MSKKQTQAKGELFAKYFDIFGCWCLVHAESHQNAFGSKVNSFQSKEEAVQFAEKEGFAVIEEVGHDQ